MIKRYSQPVIEKIWSDEHRFRLWQESEQAAIRARYELGRFPGEAFREITEILEGEPIDLAWIYVRDAEIHHDLNSFLDERTRFLPAELQQYFHKKMTSYDTEEPALARMLAESTEVVLNECGILRGELRKQALLHRNTVMLGKTHGQQAEMQTFGKQVLTWYVNLLLSEERVITAATKLKFSKMSGAVGNYSWLDPEEEGLALSYLGLEPFYGATQVMPRELYAPLADALCQLVMTLDKTAHDIRLGARSPYPILQEPFKKKQKGSSAMPQKRNPIRTEQLQGMARLAKGYRNAIVDGIVTWEERSIEQSCVERVAWPDLFHTVVHSLKVMTGVLSGLKVYPDNMLREIVESRGCYASSEAKEVLAEIISEHGLGREDAYRVIQLAAFNVHMPTMNCAAIRQTRPPTYDGAQYHFNLIAEEMAKGRREMTLESIITTGQLFHTDDLEIDLDQIREWNTLLLKIFDEKGNLARWKQCFSFEHLLRNEPFLFQKILGE